MVTSHSLFIYVSFVCVDLLAHVVLCHAWFMGRAIYNLFKSDRLVLAKVQILICIQIVQSILKQKQYKVTINNTLWKQLHL